MASTAINPIAADQLRQRNNAALPVAKSTIHSGNSSSSSDSGSDDEIEIFTPPNFTVKDLLGAIPKHCFERSAIKSGSYLVLDLILLATFAYLATYIDLKFGAKGSVLNGAAGRVARVAAWTVYVLAAGHVGTGVWVIAHECGHQAFSPSKTINNTVGWIFHSALLVPYHSWRISHGRHHAATGSMERDEVFVPKTRSKRGLAPEAEIAAAKAAALEKGDETAFEKLDELLEDAPLWNFLNVLAQQLVGWPAYLIRNASGQNYGRWTNHFDPESPIFDKRHFWQIIASDIGMGITATALILWGMNRGFGEVARYYLLPYLVVNHLLVMITFLQHTDTHLPHYYKDTWTFPRGALCTIDRSYLGPVGDFVLHGICDTHVLHHINSRIPHYNGYEATEAIKAVIGDHYQKSDENMYVSLWKSYRDCKFVEDASTAGESCVFYKNAQGKAQRRAVWDADSGVDVKSSGSESE